MLSMFTHKIHAEIVIDDKCWDNRALAVPRVAQRQAIGAFRPCVRTSLG